MIVWNNVEYNALKVFRHLMRADDVATYAVWSSFQSLSPRFDLIDVLASKRLTGAEASQIAELTRYSKNLAGERNFIVHSMARLGLWHANDTPDMKFVMAGNPGMRKAGMLSKNQALTIAEILEATKDFDYLANLWGQANEGLSASSLGKYLGPVTYRRPLRASRPRNEPDSIA